MPKIKAIAFLQVLYRFAIEQKIELDIRRWKSIRAVAMIYRDTNLN